MGCVGPGERDVRGTWSVQEQGLGSGEGGSFRENNWSNAHNLLEWPMVREGLLIREG